MRDIRSDLQERLKSVSAERDHLKERLDALTSVESSLRGLLREESTRWESIQKPLFDSSNRRGASHANRNGRNPTPLSNLLDKLLDDGKVHTTDELVEKVIESGLPVVENKSPKRVVRFGLLGKRKAGSVRMVAKGMWQKGEGAKA